VHHLRRGGDRRCFFRVGCVAGAVSPVANSASDVFNILATNVSNPRVSDYKEIGAFSYYFITCGEARGILQEALDRMLLDNRVRMGLVPREKPPSRVVLEEMMSLRKSGTVTMRWCGTLATL